MSVLYVNKCSERQAMYMDYRTNRDGVRMHEDVQSFSTYLSSSIQGIFAPAFWTWKFEHKKQKR